MPRRFTGCACGVGVPLMYVSHRMEAGLGRGRARRGRSEAHGARTRMGRDGGCTAHPRHLVRILKESIEFIKKSSRFTDRYLPYK